MINKDSKEAKKGRFFTGDAQTDNNLVSGAIGFGLGVGGALLAESFLNSQNPCRHRRDTDTGATPRFLGALGGHQTPCYPQPYPYPAGGYGAPPPAPYNPPAQYPPQYHRDSYSPPSSSYGAPSSSYGAPSSNYGAPTSSYGAPSSSYGAPSSSYGAPSSSYGAPSSGYKAPSYVPTYKDEYSAPGQHGFRAGRTGEAEATKTDLDHSEFRFSNSGTRSNGVAAENLDARTLQGVEEPTTESEVTTTSP